MNDFGIATFAIAQGMTSFLAFMPRITDVRKAAKDDESFRADLRVGEMASAVVTIGIGALITALTGNRLPVVISIIMVLTIIGLYESVLRVNPVELRPYNYNAVR